MKPEFILTGYSALAKAEYDKLEDGTFCGTIPASETVRGTHPTLACY
ncbi:MAG: hypothetical protein ABFS56_18990 [Pseudomonadota bacterium]